MVPLFQDSAYESCRQYSYDSALLSRLHGNKPLAVRIALNVCIPTLAIGEELSLRSHGEQHGVEELIPEPRVEPFAKAVLPQGAGLDVGRTGDIAAIASIP